MDGVDSHKKFHKEQSLNFDLLADPDKSGHQAYGFEKMVRAFILIDRDGVIRFVNKKYDLSKEQTEALMSQVAALKPKK
jgi:peroxiredoxin